MPGIAVLGPVTLVADDGSTTTPGSRRQCLLLAVLASRAPHAASADALVEALWGDSGALPAHPVAALQSQVFRLRRQLTGTGVRLDTEGSGYVLVTDAAGSRSDDREATRGDGTDTGEGLDREAIGDDGDVIDAVRFERLVARATEPGTAPARALALLDAALSLWRGPAYLEVADHEAIRPEVLRLDELCADAAEARAALLIDAGRPGDAARAMEALAVDQPYRERAVVLRVRALAAAGRHAEALAVLAGFRRTLADDLGLDPSPALAAVEEDILRPARPPAARPGLPGNSLVGREVDLAEVTGRLETGRMVTLTGPGGVGKSRLALHASVRAARAYGDGVYLCELAEVAADGAVAPAVATALRLQRGAGAAAGSDTERILDFLATRRTLLVLDNCEHVLDGARSLVAAVLAGSADVDVIATSRRRLGVEGEHVVPVAPLGVPVGDDADAPAVSLFVDRARDLRPGFVLDTAGAAAVCELCRLVDGLPLAIELAAARTVAQAPAEIVHDIAGRLDRLGDPQRSRERHRSISAVVAWSYDPLGPVEQHLARTAAVFAGGFTLAAAAEVADVVPGEAAAALTALVEASLVVARDVGGTTRFSMLEPVRQFAEGRAAEAGTLDAVRARHARWATTWLEAADAGLRGPDEARWAVGIAAEVANLRAAHGWCLAHDRALGARLVGALYWYAYWYGATEAFAWAAETVAAAAGAGQHAQTEPALAPAFATATLGACRRGELDGARSLATRGTALAQRDDDPTTRWVWEAYSSAESLAGNYARAIECHDRAIVGARAARDTGQEAREHAARALALGYLGRADDTDGDLATARELAAAAGCATVVGFCDYVAGEIRLDTEPGEALPLLLRARDAARRVGNAYLAAIAGVSALSCAARAGDPAGSLGGYAELLDYFERTGSPAQQWTTVRTLIESLARVGHDEPAAVLSGALAASPAALPLVGPDAGRMRQAGATLAARLGAPRFAELTAEGASLGDDRALAYARRHAAAEAAAAGGDRTS
jgi:predicted ATPase/DNA-binding SARP family transcriptional activator